MGLFIEQLFENPIQFFIQIMVVVFSVCLHEYFHARFSLGLGDDTAARNGHLTLNPLKQMGVTSLILLLIVGFAWGQVPVNRANFREKWQAAISSFAGPLANLLLFLVAGLLLTIYISFAKNPESNLVSFMLTFAAVINMVLFLFNMIPCYPLDGFGVLTAFHPIQSLSEKQAERLNVISIVIMILAVCFAQYLFKAAYFCTVQYIQFLRIFGL